MEERALDQSQASAWRRSALSLAYEQAYRAPRTSRSPVCGRGWPDVHDPDGGFAVSLWESLRRCRRIKRGSFGRRFMTPALCGRVQHLSV